GGHLRIADAVEGERDVRGSHGRSIFPARVGVEAEVVREPVRRRCPGFRERRDEAARFVDPDERPEDHFLHPKPQLLRSLDRIERGGIAEKMPGECVVDGRNRRLARAARSERDRRGEEENETLHPDCCYTIASWRASFSTSRPWPRTGKRSTTRSERISPRTAGRTRSARSFRRCSRSGR